MGFLLTSYNSLPEQVEANKEKCKDLQNQIDNIDTHEIEEVKAQVQTNTQNISNLTQGLGVTNTALNAVTLDVNDLKPRVTNLETKTSNMSKSGVDTAFSHSINVEGSINSLDGISTDGIISAGSDIISESVIKGSVLVANNDNGEGRIYVDDDGNMSLAQALNSGTLITDNNISEYAPQTRFYIHNICVRVNYNTSAGLTIINKSSEAMNLTAVKAYLDNLLNTGYHGSNMVGVDAFNYNNNTMSRVYLKRNGTNISSYDNTNTVLFTDIVVDGDRVVEL